MNKIELSDEHPKCRHGPTLLFHTDGEKFFACSACRDRRECQIYIPYDERKTKKSQKIIAKYAKEYERFKEHLQVLQNTRSTSPL